MTARFPVPSSKSMTQRALLLAALAEAPTRIVEPLDCDDSRRLRAALTTLGADITEREGGRILEVVPMPLPLRAPTAPLDCGNAGTAVRFLAPLAMLCDGELAIDGDERMRQRPIGPLADGLIALGLDVRFDGRPGCPPLVLERVRDVGGSVAVDASLSSQFVSGLLLVAPRLPSGLRLALEGELVSRPYVDMTIAMMRAQGCTIARDDVRTLAVSRGPIRGGTVHIEPDWSAAAFLLVAGKITGRAIEAVGALPLGTSLQGDAAIEAFLARVDLADENVFDLTDVPDLIAPLAALALFARRPTRIRGAAHTRVKECDRIAVLARELRKLGAVVAEHADGLDLEPLSGRPSAEVTLDPEGDHRMAMAFGVLSLRCPGIAVSDRRCVTKSFPAFWETLDEIRAQ